jgi:putative GTP pyrophosphokinase
MHKRLGPMSGTGANPTGEARFTKGEINRAGKLLCDLQARTEEGVAEYATVEPGEDELARSWDALTWWRSLHARPLSSVAANLRYHVGKEGGKVQGRIEVTQRLKRLDTVIGKLAREQGRVTQMHDIGGVRALLPSLDHVYAVNRRLRKTWTIIRVRDYIAEPKASGYRALHLVVKRMGYPVEVQLRTMGQDVWANAVENAGRDYGIQFKFGEGDERAHRLFGGMAEAIAAFDRGELSDDNLRVALSEMPSLTLETRRDGRTDELS